MDNNIKKKFTKDANRENLASLEIFKSKEDGKLYYLDSNRQKVEVNTGGPFIPTPNSNVPIKTYCAEILQLGIGTTPQVNAVIANTFNGTVAPAALLNIPSENGFIRIDSLDDEFTIGKTMVTITPSETNAAGVNCLVFSLTDGRISILCQDIANSLADKNNVQILVKIEVYA